MRDFPIFPTEHGAASLTLRHIPYSGCAYIRIQSAADPEALLRDCADFCRQAGAERIFAAGHEALEKFPLHTAVLEMRGEAFVDAEKRKCLFPVTEATVKRWREYYNRRMAGVDNAAFLEARDEEKITDSCGAYFVHENGTLLGIGWLDDCKLLAVAAEPGRGEVVMHTLMSLVEGDQMTLEVASTNKKAIRLYEKLGFLVTRELERWYCVEKN